MTKKAMIKNLTQELPEDYVTTSEDQAGVEQIPPSYEVLYSEIISVRKNWRDPTIQQVELLGLNFCWSHG